MALFLIVCADHREDYVSDDGVVRGLGRQGQFGVGAYQSVVFRIKDRDDKREKVGFVIVGWGRTAGVSGIVNLTV